MNSSLSSVVWLRLGLILSLSGVTLSARHNVPPEGFRALFNGQDLAGWWGANEEPRNWLSLAPEALAEKMESSLTDVRTHWSVKDGELINAGEGLYLTTRDDFRDYELRLDYRTVAGADSGIYLKGTPQVQIWDFTEAGGKWEIGADKGSGGLFNNHATAPGKHPLVPADRPFGEWNQFRIIQIGARTWVWLNDQLVVDGAIMEDLHFAKNRQRPLPVAGPIQLQTHGGEIRWRNIFVREIEGDEAIQRLRANRSAPFERIFNGHDLTGWTGAVESYEVRDGVLASRADQAGTLYTQQTFANFVARLEFKLSPGSNNGVAIRYPGEGDAAYTGMAELQILDDTAPPHHDLDPRQYHGSAYGMAAAFRGYHRPLGEWNFQEITVDGSTIKVELNGTVILSTDLSEVTEYLKDKPHPGKDRVQGHFGFAGYRSPVEYRNIAILRRP